MRLKPSMMKFTGPQIQVAWIFWNLIGFLLAHSYILQRIIRVNSTSFPSIIHMFLYALANFAINGLLFAGSQTAFLFLFFPKQKRLHWFLFTWLSFTLISTVPFFLLPRVAQATQENAFFGSLFFQSEVLTGLLLLNRSSLVIIVLLAAGIGLILGLLYGMVIGVFQSATIPIHEQKTKWLSTVSFSWGTAYMLDSILITLVTNTIDMQAYLHYRFFLCIPIWIISAFSTRKLIINICRQPGEDMIT